MYSYYCRILLYFLLVQLPCSAQGPLLWQTLNGSGLADGYERPVAIAASGRQTLVLAAVSLSNGDRAASITVFDHRFAIKANKILQGKTGDFEAVGCPLDSTVTTTTVWTPPPYLVGGHYFYRLTCGSGQRSGRTTFRRKAGR